MAPFDDEPMPTPPPASPPMLMWVITGAGLICGFVLALIFLTPR